MNLDTIPRIAHLAVAALVLLALSVGSDAAPRTKQLPRGGVTLFPAHRVVGFCGTPGAPALGRLTGDLDAPTKELLAKARAYGSEERRALPALELIAVVGLGAPGDDGMWRRRVPDAVVDRYLAAAREARALLLLGIQPGRSDFLTEAKHFDRWLRAPEVGLALDPEWAVASEKRLGEVFGETSGATIDEVASYLSGIVEAGGLPEKALVYHQVTSGVVKDAAAIRRHRGVAIIQSIDGFGPKHAKVRTYDLLSAEKPEAAHPGIKLFFEEDTRGGAKLMTPEEVLSLRPVPEYVMYE